jgi:hypothetical protein
LSLEPELITTSPEVLSEDLPLVTRTEPLEAVVASAVTKFTFEEPTRESTPVESSPEVLTPVKTEIDPPFGPEPAPIETDPATESPAVEPAST